jgi:hypothetical protein
LAAGRRVPPPASAAPEPPPQPHLSPNDVMTLVAWWQSSSQASRPVGGSGAADDQPGEQFVGVRGVGGGGGEPVAYQYPRGGRAADTHPPDGPQNVNLLSSRW